MLLAPSLSRAGLFFPGAAYLIISQGRGKAMLVAEALYVALFVGTVAAAEGGWMWLLAWLFLAD
jgi:hypothetical protein